MNDYKIELGTQLNTKGLKEDVAKLDDKYKVKLGIDLKVNDIKKRIGDYNKNTNNAKLHLKVKLDTDDIKKQIRELNLSGTSGGKGASISVDATSLKDSLKDVKSLVADIKNTLGTLDSKSGMKDFLSSINQIATALGKAENESDSLVKSLSTLSKKDFSVNFGVNMGGSNPIGRNTAYGNKVRNETLPQLKQQTSDLVKFYNDTYKESLNEFEVLQKMVSGTKLSNGDFFENFLLGKDSVVSRMSSGSLASQMQAYKQYMDMFKQAASLKGLDISGVTSSFSKTADDLIKDAQDVQTGANEMQDGFEKLKQVFGGNSINVEGISTQLDSIVADLDEIKVVLQGLSSGVSVDGLIQSFDRLSETIEKLVSNATLAKNVLGDSLGGSASIDTGAINKVEKISDNSTAAIIQNEKKKQEAYKATAETVMYHAGIVSKLNKAETNGRFYGSNRGTGYFGTGHYFVDSATKHELDNDSHYNKLPYTSIDISKYDNLFKATTDEVAGKLHTFLSNLTAFTQGSDSYDVSELFAQFKSVFGDTIMDIKEFGSKLDQLKTFMSNSDFYDRSDSVSTQFMKSLGYGGVDTRGTGFADTKYGTVIYDLKEESILQANITDELQKQGQMLEKINYEKGQVFDKDADDRIRQQLDEQAKRKEIAEEYERSFDTANFDKADAALTNAKNRLREIDDAIGYYQNRIENLDDAYEEYVRDSERNAKELKSFGLFDDDDDWLDDSLLIQDEDEWKNLQAEIIQDSISELSQEKAKLQSEMPSLEEVYNREAQLSQDAYEQAKQTVEQRRLEAQQALESANAVVKGEERKQEAYRETADTIQKVSKITPMDGQLVNIMSSNIRDAAQKAGIDLENYYRSLQDVNAFQLTNADVAAIADASEPIVNQLGIESYSGYIKKMREIANTVVQEEEKKQQAIKETANVQEQADNRGQDEISQAQKVANEVTQAEEKKQQAYKETRKLISDSAQEAIDKVSSQSIDKAFVVDESDSIKFRREMENLVSQWTDAKGKLTDIKINTQTFYDGDTGRNIEKITSAIVTYNNELGETIKKTIALRQIDTKIDVVDGNEMTSPVYGFVEVSGQYSKSLGKTKAQTDAFVKQQKKSVADLTNTINQLNRAATDKNAARPIKLSSHLTSLANKYDEITAAIQRMESASSDTFVDEQNNVRRLISEFKSLVSEYRNADNVSTKMKGTDLTSGVNIALNDFKKFKSDAKDYPQLVGTINKLRNALNEVGDVSSLNKFNDQLRIARSELAKIKSETTAANRSEKVGINVSGLESKIADLQRISPQIDKFETEIDGAKVSVQSLLNDLKQINTQGDFSVVNSRFKAFVDSAKAAGITVAETSKKVKSIGDIKFDIEVGKIDDDVSKIHEKLNRLSDVSEELCGNVRAVDAAYEKLDTASKLDTDDITNAKKLTDTYEAYVKVLKTANNELDIQARKETAQARSRKLEQDKETLKLNTLNWMNENTRAAKEYGTKLKELISLIDKVDDVGLKDVGRQIKNVQKTAQVMGKTGLTVFDKLKAKAKEYMTYLSAAELFMYAEQALREMFNTVKEIDTAMTGLYRVTDLTAAEYDALFNNMISSAKEYGATLNDIINATTDWVRAGFDANTSLGLAEVTTMYQHISDLDYATAAENLITAYNGFKDELNGAFSGDTVAAVEYIADIFNELDK